MSNATHVPVTAGLDTVGRQSRPLPVDLGQRLTLCEHADAPQPARRRSGL